MCFLMCDKDDWFVDPENWDDGDRAYEKYLDDLASVADESELYDWDFEPQEIEFDDLDNGIDDDLNFDLF